LEGTSIVNESHEQLALLSALKLALPTVEIGGVNTHPISSASLTQWFQTFEDLSKQSQVTLLVQQIFFAMTLDKQIGHPSKSSLEQIRLVSSSNDDDHRSIGRMDVGQKSTNS
jgi:hypothetical protein